MSEELEDMDLESLLEDDSSEDNSSLGESDEAMEIINLANLGEDVTSKSPLLKPISNDPVALLNSGITQGSPLQRALGDPTADDSLLESIRSGDPTATILNNVLEEIAEEVCYLKAYRNTGWEDHTDFSDVSAKRIRSLKSLVESLVEREKLKNSKDTGKVDFHSKNFENVFAHFLGIIKETFEKVSVPKQYEDIFFTQLAKDLDGFERAAEKIYYGKKK